MGGGFKYAVARLKERALMIRQALLLTQSFLLAHCMVLELSKMCIAINFCVFMLFNHN